MLKRVFFFFGVKGLWLQYLKNFFVGLGLVLSKTYLVLPNTFFLSNDASQASAVGTLRYVQLS